MKTIARAHKMVRAGVSGALLLAFITAAAPVLADGDRTAKGVKKAKAAVEDADDAPPPVAPVAPTEKPDPPVRDEALPEKKPAKKASMGPQGTFFTGAAVSSLPAVLFGYFPIDDLATTVGLGFTYNGNGDVTSPLTGVKGAGNNKVGEDLFLDLIYFVHDQGPFAMGPELNFITSLSPNVPGTVVIFTPMWALRYAPWKAPIAIGTGIGVGFTFQSGAKPMASLATQGLDLVYAF